MCSNYTFLTNVVFFYSEKVCTLPQLKFQVLPNKVLIHICSVLQYGTFETNCKSYYTGTDVAHLICIFFAVWVIHKNYINVMIIKSYFTFEIWHREVQNTPIFSNSNIK